MNNDLNILLLEDNPTDADLIQQLLQRAGLSFNAVIAGNEQEFLAALEGNKFHAVLADNALPQYSSMEALKLLRVNNPYAAFVLVTGTVSEEFAVSIMQQGADDYILKTNLTRLPAALMKAIEKKRVQLDKEIAEKEIENEKELSDSIINSLPGIFYLCNKEGKFLRWNKNFERISGYSNSEINKMTPEYFFAGKDRDHMTRYMKKTFATGYAEIEVSFKAKDQKTFPYYIISKAINFEGSECLLGVGMDMSASKQYEKELQELNNELRSVVGHLEKVKEEEQARIAREVHDQLGQQITGLKMDLFMLQKKCDTIAGAEGLKNKMVEMSDRLDETVRTVRKIASDLRPAILDDFGLVEALDWHNREFTIRSGIPVSFIQPSEKTELDPAVTIGLFRIYQEALTNIVRHAEAKSVTISLEMLPQQMILIIADDGKGFDSGKIIKSLGLLGMKERAHMIGGSLTIESEVGTGTTLIITVTPGKAI